MAEWTILGTSAVFRDDHRVSGAVWHLSCYSEIILKVNLHSAASRALNLPGALCSEGVGSAGPAHRLDEATARGEDTGTSPTDSR